MLDILTPLSKLTRVSRSIGDVAAFTDVAPGIWGQIESDGSINKVANASTLLVFKLIINSASDNKYESQDVEVGRIATLESPGARCKVSSTGYTGAITAGADLIVSTVSTENGKLKAVPATPGTYVVVARCEQVNAGEGWILFETISPRTVVVT